MQPTSPEEYIKGRLSSLADSSRKGDKSEGLSLEERINKLLLFKKFRKYSAKPELRRHIEEAVSLHTREGTPINCTFLNGAYKLWRLEESPHADWAELFSLMYFTDWLKPICDIYPPGVWFDFYMDDWIVTRLNGVPFSDVSAYIESFNELLSFLRTYQPQNLRMTLTPVGSKLPSTEAFESKLEEGMQDLLAGNKPDIGEKEEASIRLNAKVTEQGTSDPLWRERISITHALYLKEKRAQGYHMRPDKILVFTQPLPSGMVLAVGTTKASVAKFWVGVGALKRRGDSYIETVLSPAQIAASSYSWEPIRIEGLTGKNFNRIRVVDELTER